MSIRIGINPQSPYVNYTLQDTIVLNTNDPTKKTLLYLLNNNSTNESYVQVGDKLLFGSSNDSFILKDILGNSYWNISSNLFTYLQPVAFGNDINLSDKIIIGQDDILFQEMVIFDIESNGFHIIESNTSLVEIKNNTYDIKTESLNVYSERINFYNDIQVDRIRPTDNSSNVVVDGIILNKFETMSGVFKNSIIVDYTKIPKGILENEAALKINKLNTCNYIDCYSDSNIIFIVDNNGSIGINTDATNTTLNIYGIHNDYSIKINDKSYIDKRGHISIGKIKNINNIKSYLDIANREIDSLLTIHRDDTLKDYEIIRDPLIYVTMDYNIESNIINENLSNVSFDLNGLYPIIKQNYNESGYQVIINYLPFEYPNTIFYKETINVISTTLDNRIGLKLFEQQYNYGGYSIYHEGITESSGLIVNESNIKVLAGLWLTNKNELINQFRDLNNIGNNYVLNRFTCNIDIFDDSFTSIDTYTITLDFYLLIERMLEPIYIPFIDITPSIIDAPEFLRIESNNNFIANIDSSGMLKLGNDITDDYKIWTDSKGYINQLHINYITSNINLLNNDIEDVSNIYVKNIILEDSINIANVVYIDKNGGLTLPAGNASFDTLAINMIDSSNIYYDLDNTIISNKLSIVNDRANIKSVEQNLYIQGNGIYIDGEGIYISSSNINPNIKVHGYNGVLPSLSFIHNINSFNIKYNILTYNTSQELVAQASPFLNYNTLDINNGNNIYIRLIDDINTINIGNNNFLCVSCTREQNKVNIGIPKDSLLVANYDVNDWYKHFDSYNYKPLPSILLDPLRAVHDDITLIEAIHMNHPLTTYGNVRFADTNNLTLIEIRQYEDNYGAIQLPTMNVFGNIRCRPRRQRVNAQNRLVNVSGGMALEVMGSATFEDKVYTVGGVASLSDRRVKKDLEVINDSINKIKQLSGYTFKRIDRNNKKETGLIAQEVEKVLPEAVIRGADDRLSIEYGNMVGLLVEAIKNLDERLLNIENKLNN